MADVAVDFVSAGQGPAIAIKKAAAQLAAEDHTHAIGDVTGLQAILDDYETRIAALEAAAAG